MAISRIVPPIDYLKEASRASLQSFELTRLNHAANLRREIGVLMDQWITETSEAMLARWMLDQRMSPHAPQPTPDIFQTFFENAPTDPSSNAQSVTDEIVPAPPRYSNPRHSATITRKTQRARSGAAD